MFIPNLHGQNTQEGRQIALLMDSTSFCPLTEYLEVDQGYIRRGHWPIVPISLHEEGYMPLVYMYMPLLLGIN